MRDTRHNNGDNDAMVAVPVEVDPREVYDIEDMYVDTRLPNP